MLGLFKYGEVVWCVGKLIYGESGELFVFYYFGLWK